jgi:hypothetical protein
LHQDDKRNTPISADDAEQGAEGIQGLPDDDAAFNGRLHLEREIVLHQSLFGRAYPAEVERRSQKQNIQPVFKQRQTVGGELISSMVENGVIETANRNRM